MIRLFGRDWTIPEAAMMLAGSATVVAIVVQNLKPGPLAQNRRQGSVLRQAFEVLRRDPETLLFTGAALLLIGAPVVWILTFFATVEPGTPTGLTGRQALAAALIAPEVFVIVVTLLSFTGGGLCTAAVLACAMKRLKGEDPTIFDGARAMVKVLPRVLVWAGLVAGLKMPLVWLARRSEAYREYAFLDGVTWQEANAFVLPIMLTEDVGCIEALRRAERLGRLAGAGRLKDAQEGAGLTAVVVFLIAWVAGMALSFSGGGETLASVVGPMLLMPFAVFIATAAVCSTLYLIVVAAVYLEAEGARSGCRNQVDEFFG